MKTLATELAGVLTGEALGPGDPGYEASRTVWNAMVDRRPAVVGKPVDAADVARVVRFARDRGLEIAVRGGGHNIAGHATSDGGLVVDLSAIAEVRVDPQRRRARVGGGAELGALDRAGEPFGLATTAGNVSHTGVGGLTLGGGMGWLARQFGLSCDNVESYEVVTADGTIVRASATENPDLFWGLRGGGGNFGVVTEFEFRLHPVVGRAIAADFTFDIEQAPEALRGWADLIPAASRQATFTAWAGHDADGRPSARLGFMWVGDLEPGRRLVETVRALGPAASESVRESTYVELQSVDDVVAGYGKRRYSKGFYLPALGDDAIEAFLSVADSGPAKLNGGFQSHGGAINEMPEDDAAFSHRSTLVEFGTGVGWTDAAEDDVLISAARRYAAAIEPFATGSYVNMLTDEGEAGVRRAYPPAKWTRLAALKARYDPDNVFHLNQNVPPA